MMSWSSDSCAGRSDGEDGGNEAGSLLGNTSRWIFGASEDGGGPGDFLHGELNDIAVYAEALDLSGVQELSRFGVDGLMTGEAPAEAGDGEISDDGDVDSPLNFDTIQAEAEGPESLATIDTLALLSGNGENGDPPQAETPPELSSQPAPDPEPVPEPEPGPGPGPGPEEVPEDVIEDGAITIGGGNELVIENADKLEW